jgi:hypothetical protein
VPDGSREPGPLRSDTLVRCTEARDPAGAGTRRRVGRTRRREAAGPGDTEGPLQAAPGSFLHQGEGPAHLPDLAALLREAAAGLEPTPESVARVKARIAFEMEGMGDGAH